MDSEPTTQHEADRDRILTAAGRLFYRRGIQAVGMDAVRAEAGVPLKRLYACFASKQELVRDVLARRADSWNGAVVEATSTITSPREKLLTVFDFLGDWFAEDDFRGCGFINAFGELGGVSEDVAEAARSQKRSFREYLAALTDELGGPPMLAEQLALLAEGAQTTAAIDGRPESAAVARAAAVVLIDAAMSGTAR